MEWEPLEFSNADAVISESRSAVSALERLDRQMMAFNKAQSSFTEGDGGGEEGGGGAQPSAATGKRLKEALDTLVTAIERRIEAIQVFYNNNDLNPLSSQFEMCRLMLKRALMQHAINASGGYLLQEMPPAPPSQPQQQQQQQNAAAPIASSLSTTAATVVKTSGTSPLINTTYSATPSFGGTGEGGYANRNMPTMRTHSRVSSFGGPSSGGGGGHQGVAGGGGRSVRSSFGTQRDIPISSTPSSSFAPSSEFIGAESSTSPPQNAVAAAAPLGGGKENHASGGKGMVSLKVILTHEEYEEVLRRRRSRENAAGR